MENKQDKIKYIKGYDVCELKKLKEDIQIRIFKSLVNIVMYTDDLTAIEILYLMNIDYSSECDNPLTKAFLEDKKKLLELKLIAIIDKALIEKDFSTFIASLKCAKKINMDWMN